MADKTAMEQLVEFDDWMSSIVHRDKGYEDKEVMYFPLKVNKDVYVSWYHKNYEKNKLHFLKVKKDDIEFERAWKEDIDFSSLEYLSQKQQLFIDECLRKFR